MEWKKFFERHNNDSVALYFLGERQTSVELEDLYQMFRSRFAEELAEALKPKQEE